MEVAMQTRQEGLTADEIIKNLRDEGFQITKRTFQYYIQAGILPKGTRKGAKSGGVRFYYPASVLDNLRQVFVLKSKGFKLGEIKERIVAAQQGGPGAPPPEREPQVAMPRVDLPADRRKSEEDPSATRSKAGAGLYEKVMRLTPEGEMLKLCLQCGTCGGSCPSAVDMDYTPRQLFALLQAGYDDEVLASNTAWHCVSCYNCTVRCPQHIPITEIMYTLKQLAARAGFMRITEVSDYSRIYVSLVEQFGRSFDMGLIFRCHLTHNPTSKIVWGSLALKMGRQERVVTGPSRVSDIGQLQRIIAKAKSMEDGG